MSSTCLASSGKTSETSVPDWPYLRNARFDASTVDCSNLENCNCTLPKLFGTCWPFNLASVGLGSNVSRCEGPPCMNRKMMFFAVGGKCGFFAAGMLVTAAAATAGKPKPGRRRCRRAISIAIKKLANIENKQAQPVQACAGEVIPCFGAFICFWCAAESKLPRFANRIRGAEADD